MDPHLGIESSDGGVAGWTARVAVRPGAAPECDEVAVTRISAGSSFVFQPRPSIPLTPVRASRRR